MFTRQITQHFQVAAISLQAVLQLIHEKKFSDAADLIRPLYKGHPENLDYQYWGAWLNYRLNRWANIITGIITILFVVGGGATYPHYIFIATVETICLLLIIGFAWTWRNVEA